MLTQCTPLLYLYILYNKFIMNNMNTMYFGKGFSFLFYTTERLFTDHVYAIKCSPHQLYSLQKYCFFKLKGYMIGRFIFKILIFNDLQ